MLSAMRVTGMPSLCSSQAVSRAPCKDRTCLVGDDLHTLALLDRGTDHPQRRTVACRRQGTRVTMREDAGLIGNQGLAIQAHLSVVGDILSEDAQGFLFQTCLQVSDGKLALGLGAGFHARNGPEQIDCRRTCRRHDCTDLAEARPEMVEIRGLDGTGADGQS